MGRCGEEPVEFSGVCRDRPLLVGCCLPFLLGLRPADRDLDIRRFVCAPGIPKDNEGFFGICPWVDEPVPYPGGHGCADRAFGCDVDRGELFGKGEDLRILQGVEGAVVTLHAPFPERPDHFYRLLEHLNPDPRRRPVTVEDVFVEVLARSKPENEPSRHHGPGSSCSLRNDAGVYSHRRAGDSRYQLQVCRHLGDAAEDSPDERTLTLPVCPGVVVI